MRAKVSARENLIGEVRLDARGRAMWLEELNFLKTISYEYSTRKFLFPRRGEEFIRALPSVFDQPARGGVPWLGSAV
jgi:hypothetical protein